MIKKMNYSILLLTAVSVLALIFTPGCQPPASTEGPAEKDIDLADFSTGAIVIDGMAGPGEYPFSYKDPGTGIVLYWLNDTDDLYVCLESPSTGWTAIGFDPDGFAMKGANIILFAMDGEDVLVRDDFGVESFSHSDDEALGGSFNITQYAGKKAGDGTSFEFILPLISGDEFDKVLEPGNDYAIILSINSTDTDFNNKHTDKSSTTITLNQALIDQ